MKKWQPASEGLKARFAAALPKHPDAEPRKMFGYPCCFVRGSFWIGLFEDDVVVRLPGGLNERFAETKGAPAFDPMGGRPMSGWFRLPKAVSGDGGKLGRFMAATFPVVQALPAAQKSGKAGAAAKKAAKKPDASRKTSGAGKPVRRR